VTNDDEFSNLCEGFALCLYLNLMARKRIYNIFKEALIIYTKCSHSLILDISKQIKY